MKVWGYEEGMSDSGNWIIYVTRPSGDDVNWLYDNLEWFRFTGAGNIVVGSEADALLCYMRFK